MNEKLRVFSGEWSGYYVQLMTQFPQVMRLEFADGIMCGNGSDQVGNFFIEGEYRVQDDGTVRMGWIKTYVKAHSVLYLGVYDGTAITGSWDISGMGDQFSLSPSRQGVGIDAI